MTDAERQHAIRDRANAIVREMLAKLHVDEAARREADLERTLASKPPAILH